MKKPSRNFWPVAIIAWFTIFIAGIVVFVVFASRHRDELVRADYYEQEIRYGQQMERVERTQAISDEVAVEYHPGTRCVTINLPASHARESPSGRIHFYRPSDSSLDQEFGLAVDPAGVQRVDVSHLRAGLWKVRIQWSANRKEFYYDKAIVVSGKQS